MRKVIPELFPPLGVNTIFFGSQNNIYFSQTPKNKAFFCSKHLQNYFYRDINYGVIGVIYRRSNIMAFFTKRHEKKHSSRLGADARRNL